MLANKVEKVDIEVQNESCISMRYISQMEQSFIWEQASKGPDTESLQRRPMPNEISAEDVLSEALARIEFKLDLLLKHHKVPQMEMHFPGQQCPSCGWIIDYQINLAKMSLYESASALQVSLCLRFLCSLFLQE